MQVKSFDPVTKYEPHVSNATHVITSKCLITEATILPRDVLNTRNELSQIPPAYKYLPSELTANRLEHCFTKG